MFETNTPMRSGVQSRCVAMSSPTRSVPVYPFASILTLALCSARIADTFLSGDLTITRTRLEKRLREFEEIHRLGLIYGRNGLIFGRHYTPQPAVISSYSKVKWHLDGRVRLEQPTEFTVYVIKCPGTFQNALGRTRTY